SLFDGASRGGLSTPGASSPGAWLGGGVDSGDSGRWRRQRGCYGDPPVSAAADGGGGGSGGSDRRGEGSDACTPAPGTLDCDAHLRRSQQQQQQQRRRRLVLDGGCRDG
ncbi:unnamed protein product, partial [Laminaria digitata]